MNDTTDILKKMKDRNFVFLKLDAKNFINMNKKETTEIISAAAATGDDGTVRHIS